MAVKSFCLYLAELLCHLLILLLLIMCDGHAADNLSKDRLSLCIPCQESLFAEFFFHVMNL